MERTPPSESQIDRPAPAKLRPHDWAFFAVIAGVIASAAAAFSGRLLWSAVFAAFAVAAGFLARVYSRRHPGPMPYALRWMLPAVRATHSPGHVTRLLELRSGERVLEIGPGIGVHALPIAKLLAPDGALDVLDVQQEMLDALVERAARAGISNITARRGDAQKLPYPDAAFDAAYLMTVLGEIPNPIEALREIARVIKPGGRLVIGEALLDPDFIGLESLKAEVARAGFAYERHVGRAGSTSPVLGSAEPEQRVHQRDERARREQAQHEVAERRRAEVRQ